MTDPQGDKAPGRQAFIAAVRRTVWNGTHGVGATEGPCFVCQSTVNRDNFVIGHYRDGVTGGKAQVKNMRPICDSCDHVIGKNSIEQFLRERGSTGEEKATRPAAGRPKPLETDQPEEPTANRRWLNSFLDAVSYNMLYVDFNIPIKDIKFPDIDFPDFDFPNIDFPDFDFDFDFNF